MKKQRYIRHSSAYDFEVEVNKYLNLGYTVVLGTYVVVAMSHANATFFSVFLEIAN